MRYAGARGSQCAFRGSGAGSVQDVSARGSTLVGGRITEGGLARGEGVRSVIRAFGSSCLFHDSHQSKTNLCDLNVKNDIESCERGL